ncbi:hypothetical protein ACFQ0O_24330 [Saccharopolyspora spinosporotrichia]
MRKLMTGALAAVALAGLSGGVVAANAATNAADEQALNGRAAAEAPCRARGWSSRRTPSRGSRR